MRNVILRADRQLFRCIEFCMIIHSAPQTAPKTQTATSGGPPRPPKKTARGLQDEPGEPAKERDSKLEMSMVVTNAQMTWSELLVLNGGGRPAKREELETSLDRSILALSRLAERMKKARSVFE